MAYNGVNWTAQTPITVDNLNKMDQGIKDANNNSVGIINSKDIADKEKNTYSAKIIDELVKEVYSTEERIIGTYLGKTLYRKTITGSLGTSETTSISVILGENINKLVFVSGFIFLAAPTPVNAYWNDTLKSLVQQSSTNKNQINIYYATNMAQAPFEITIEYTKTTS